MGVAYCLSLERGTLQQAFYMFSLLIVHYPE